MGGGGRSAGVRVCVCVWRSWGRCTSAAQRGGIFSPMGIVIGCAVRTVTREFRRGCAIYCAIRGNGGFVFFFSCFGFSTVNGSWILKMLLVLNKGVGFVEAVEIVYSWHASVFFFFFFFFIVEWIVEIVAMKKSNKINNYLHQLLVLFESVFNLHCSRIKSTKMKQFIMNFKWIQISFRYGRTRGYSNYFKPFRLDLSNNIIYFLLFFFFKLNFHRSVTVHKESLNFTATNKSNEKNIIYQKVFFFSCNYEISYLIKKKNVRRNFLWRWCG